MKVYLMQLLSLDEPGMIYCPICDYLYNILGIF